MGQQDRVIELLKELARQDGASVKHADEQGQPKGNAILAEELDELQNAPSAFNAWVSWTKAL